MGGLDVNNAATTFNSLFVPGQTCSKFLAPTPIPTVFACQACVNSKIFLFYNPSTEVVGYIYDPTTDSWSNQVAASSFNHYQQPCSTLNGLVYFYDPIRPEVYNPLTNTWALIPKPALGQANGVVSKVFFQ